MVLKKAFHIIEFSLAFLIFIPFILFVVIYLFFHWLGGLWLGLIVRLKWHPKGKKILFVYSNSPNWKDYIEANILPKISANSVVINWSEREKWAWNNSLETDLFKHWTWVKKIVLTARTGGKAAILTQLQLPLSPGGNRKFSGSGSHSRI